MEISLQRNERLISTGSITLPDSDPVSPGQTFDVVHAMSYVHGDAKAWQDEPTNPLAAYKDSDGWLRRRVCPVDQLGIQHRKESLVPSISYVLQAELGCAAIREAEAATNEVLPV